MILSNKLPNRHSIRLQEYDYSSSGMYFVTVCTQNKLCLFGEVIEKFSEVKENAVGAGLCPAQYDYFIRLSAHGRIIQEQWFLLPNRFRSIILHEFIVMPNHFHAIIEIDTPSMDENSTRAGQSPAPTLADIIGAFKSISTKECNKMENISGRKIWQRNYYEHIIRNEKSYTNIADYIANNSANWQSDDYYISQKI